MRSLIALGAASSLEEAAGRVVDIAGRELAAGDGGAEEAAAGVTALGAAPRALPVAIRRTAVATPSVAVENVPELPEEAERAATVISTVRTRAATVCARTVGILLLATGTWLPVRWPVAGRLLVSEEAEYAGGRIAAARTVAIRRAVAARVVTSEEPSRLLAATVRWLLIATIGGLIAVGRPLVAAVGRLLTVGGSLGVAERLLVAAVGRLLTVGGPLVAAIGGRLGVAGRLLIAAIGVITVVLAAIVRRRLVAAAGWRLVATIGRRLVAAVGWGLVTAITALLAGEQQRRGFDTGRCVPRAHGRGEYKRRAGEQHREQ